jgi:4-alpha-glucanotransferase
MVQVDASVDPVPEPGEIGVDAGYRDAFGTWRTPSPEALRAIARAMGHEGGRTPATTTPIVAVRVDRHLVTVDGGGPVLVPAGATVRLEDGTTLAPGTGLEPDLPVGHHALVAADGTERPLLVSPGRCLQPDGLRTWGVTAQLYAARSPRSWGIGDLDDLATLLAWCRGHGAGIVGLNPLHAPSPTPRPPDSPYSPSSRRWRDPLLVAIEQVPGFAVLPDAEERVRAGRRLNDGDRIDRTAAWAAKRDALRELWRRFRHRSDPAFDRYLVAHGDDVIRWGAFCTVVEDAVRSGGSADWRRWPAELRRPDAPGMDRVARDQTDEVRFWGWVQWLVDRQLAATGADDLVLSDLAVGFAADGFDAWEWQDLVADGVRIGAPPDLLGPDGQDWGLPPFVPRHLAAVGYQPLAATLRAAFRHARGVRVDHVMGLFRLYWIPPGLDATDGAYVRFPGTELLHVLAIESHRAGGLVVGEDLGTVEDGVRETLADAAVLSTRLLWFEDRDPREWPRQAMAAITTHDLPTVAGIWTGHDLADLHAAGVTVPPDGDELFRHRLRVTASCDDGASLEHVIVEAHRAVAESPAVVATAALDDLVAAPRRPNVPGTIDEHPNWRLPLPVTVDDLTGHPLAERVAEVMGATRHDG